MAVIRQLNLLGQQRVDVPHLRSLESAICGDFDLLAGRLLSGRAPLVVNGFKLVTTGAVTADQLQLDVSDGLVLHFFASESGSLFSVAADRSTERLNSTNARVQGNFAPNQINYIGVDFVRVADESTVDLVMFLDANKSTETPKTVPLGRVIDYRIVISTTDFNALAGVCPVAKVTTNSSNEVVVVEDARNMLFRLANGGSNPNPGNFYTWPSGRKEATSTDPFAGGDKSIASFKSFVDALTTRMWELGGGEYWYSPTADRNVRLLHTGSPFVSTGEYFEWDGSNLHWKGLRIAFDNSTASSNAIKDQTTNSTGLTDLLDGQCLYVDLDRTTNRSGGTALVAQKAPLVSLGTGSPPGSRLVFAWRYGSQIFTRDQGYAVGSASKIATIAAAGAVQLSASAEPTPSAPTVAMVKGNSLFQAFCGGVTRGSSTGLTPVTDFIGGSGDLVIGGGDMDYNVVLRTTRTQDTVHVTGRQVWAATGKAVLEVEHQAPTLADDNQLVRARAYNDGTSQTETSFTIDATGALGHRVVPVAPAAPTPGTGADATIRAKTFFRTNGLSSPNTRDQYCIMWWDGSVEVVSESPPY